MPKTKTKPKKKAKKVALVASETTDRDIYAAINTNFPINRFDTPVNVDTPTDYHSAVSLSREYEQTTIAGYLIENQVDAANTGFHFEIPGNRSSPRKLLSFWNNEVVNKGANNLLPGMDEVNEWIYEAISTDGMAVMNTKWESVPFKSKTYQLPTRVTIHGAHQTILFQENLPFGDEVIIFVRDPNQTARLNTEIVQTTPNLSQLQDARSNPNYFVLNPSVATCLKWRWNPSKGPYPTPPLKKIFSQLNLWRTLWSMDAGTAEGIVQSILAVFYGDKDHDIKPDKTVGGVTTPGTLSEVKNAVLQAGQYGRNQLMALPFYADIRYIHPDTAALLSETKFKPSLEIILMAFGIKVESARGVMTVNAKGQEGIAKSLQNRGMGAVNWLIEQIWMRNKNLVTGAPPKAKAKPVSLLEKDAQTFFKEMFQLGSLSLRTLHEKCGLDHDEQMIELKEQANDEMETIESATPIQFKQGVVDDSKEKPEEENEEDLENADETD